MTIILGVDPSSSVSGWSLLLDKDLVATGTIDASKQPYDRRFSFIVDEFDKVRARYRPDDVACERPTPIQGVKVPALEVAVSSIRAWAKKNKLHFYLYSPGTWKHSVTGHGFSTKEQVARCAFLIFPQLPPETTEHQTDAICIALHHAGVRRLMQMAKEQNRA